MCLDICPIINDSTTKQQKYVGNRQRKRHDRYKQIGRPVTTVALGRPATTVAVGRPVTTVALVRLLTTVCEPGGDSRSRGFAYRL